MTHKISHKEIFEEEFYYQKEKKYVYIFKYTYIFI